MARKNSIRVDIIEVIATQLNLLESCGLPILIKYLTKLGFFRALCRYLPVSRSNSGYGADVYVKTLWALKLLYPDVNAPLSRIDEMRKSKAVLRALQINSMPYSGAVGDWLRRMGNCECIATAIDKSAILGGYADGLERMQELFYGVTNAIMKTMGKELGDTLDFDASCIYGGKSCDRWMYNKETGSMSYLGFMGRLCVMAELEYGNHSPHDHINQRIGSCISMAQMSGHEVNTVRSDSAGYQGDVINACMEAGRTFYVRADADCSVKSACDRIRDWKLYDVAMSKDKTNQHEMGAIVHTMGNTKEAFTLVVKRVASKESLGHQPQLPELDGPVWNYCCVATNNTVARTVDDDGLTPGQVEEIYNNHADVENRIKQLKSDAGIGRLSTSKLDANRVYVYIMALLHNMNELFKFQCLPGSFKTKRLPTIMRELFSVPGKITLRAHKMIVDLPVYMRHLVIVYRDILRIIKQDVRALCISASPPAYAEMIYRNN